MQLLLAAMASWVLVGLAGRSVDGRARAAIALIAIAVTATYVLHPRFM